MKITEARLKTLIAEEREKILLERKIPHVKIALTEIALMSAQLHDKEDAIKTNTVAKQITTNNPETI